MHAALCEHWAVYHFWSVANHRHEMAVLELYDATPRDISVSDVLFGAENNTQSAFLPPPLDVSLPLFPPEACSVIHPPARYLLCARERAFPLYVCVRMYYVCVHAWR